MIALTPAPPIAAIFAVAFVAAGLGAIDQPARASAIPRLVPIERLPAAIGLNQLVFNGAAIVGPALGGIVLAVAGVSAAYLIDVVTFAAAIVALLMIAPIPPAPGAVRRASPRSSRDCVSHERREVLATFLVDLNAMVFGSPRSLVSGARAQRVQGRPGGVGFMASAAGLGAFVGAVFSGWTGPSAGRAAPC